jgi:hypothetical protein
MKTELSFAQYRTTAYRARTTGTPRRARTRTGNPSCRPPESRFEDGINEKLSIIFDILSIILPGKSLLTHVISETYDFLYHDRSAEILVIRHSSPYQKSSRTPLRWKDFVSPSLLFRCLAIVIRPGVPAGTCPRPPQKKPCHVGSFFHNAPQSPLQVINAQLAEEPK